MMNCIAIDDEPRALDIIKSHVSRVDFLELKEVFVDPFKAVSYVRENAIDLIFLDINMPDIDGFDLLKHFGKKPLIIFTTAHSEYALQSYEVEAVDYLLKPFDFSRFLMAVTKAQDKFAQSSPSSDFFFVNVGHQKKKIKYDEIYYVEGEGNYVNYCTSNGKILVRSTIKDTLSILPATAFVQIHRSYIVALAWIEKIEDNHVHISDTEISISASYKEDFMKMIESLNR